LGVRDPIQTQPAARMAALIGLEMFGRERVGIPDIALQRPSPDLIPTIAALRGQLGPNFEPLAQWHSDPGQLASASFDHASQRWWAGHVSFGEALTPVQSGLCARYGTLTVPKWSNLKWLDVCATQPPSTYGYPRR